MECIAPACLLCGGGDDEKGSPSRRDSAGSNTSLRSVKSEKEDDRRVAFALTKQVRRHEEQSSARSWEF